MIFAGKDDGPSIEEFLKEGRFIQKTNWKGIIDLHLQGDVTIWYKSLDYGKMRALSDEEFDQVFLDKWSRAKSKEKKKCLFSCDNFILQFLGCIQNKNIIVSISPSGKYNFINV
jgi:hypothetical protein